MEKYKVRHSIETILQSNFLFISRRKVRRIATKIIIAYALERCTNMWLVINKQDTNDCFEVPTEREAYEFCKESGDQYFYKHVDINDYMERITNRWLTEKR